MRVHQQHEIPESIAMLDHLDSDYLDVFVAMVPEAARYSAEQWARATIEGAHPAGRFLAWRVACSLRLDAPPSPDSIAGWRIVGRDPRWVRVEASSWFMTANMIFTVDDDQVSFATLVRYDTPVGRLVWTPVSAIHRSVAPGFLAAGTNRLLRPDRGGRAG